MRASTQRASQKFLARQCTQRQPALPQGHFPPRGKIFPPGGNPAPALRPLSTTRQNFSTRRQPRAGPTATFHHAAKFFHPAANPRGLRFTFHHAANFCHSAANPRGLRVTFHHAAKFFHPAATPRRLYGHFPPRGKFLPLSGNPRCLRATFGQAAKTFHVAEPPAALGRRPSGGRAQWP